MTICFSEGYIYVYKDVISIYLFRYIYTKNIHACLQADTCVVLRVHGMTCGSCTQTVARALEGVNGVASATVTLGSSGPTGGLQGPGLAEVWVNAGFPGVEAAVSAVEDAGFEAQSLPKS